MVSLLILDGIVTLILFVAVVVREYISMWRIARDENAYRLACAMGRHGNRHLLLSTMPFLGEWVLFDIGECVATTEGM